MLKTPDKPSAAKLRLKDPPKKEPGVTSEVVSIYPDMARAWLSKNVKNRKISPKHKAKLARDMKSDSWQMTGDAIRFDVNGNLLDGQHRLQACIDSDAPFQSFVIYGLPPESQDVMDTVRPRTAADMLSMHGFHGTSILTGMCRYIAEIKTGVTMDSVKLSNAEILHMVALRPKLSVSIGHVWKLPPGIPRPALGLVHYIASEMLGNAGDADEFINVFKTGVPAYPNDPAHTLRERFIRSKSDTRQAIKRSENLRACAHAWNAFSKGGRWSTFAFRRSFTSSG